MPVEIDVSVGRLPATVEATAYFVVAEAPTNKHARAGHAEVTARIEDSTVQGQRRDDGVGGALPDGGGLIGLADRLAALDGEPRVDSPAKSGTLVAAASPSGLARASSRPPALLLPSPEAASDAPRRRPS